MKKEEEIKLFKKENSYLNKRLLEMDVEVDSQEQYSRRNCLLVHGEVEETVEDTNEKIMNTLQQSMDETIKLEDIVRLHRLGKPKSLKNVKPMTKKFARYNTRNRIYRNKKKLKGTGISVTESLTTKRINVVEKAREEHSFSNVWSQDGKIMFFDKSTNKVKIYYSYFFLAMSQTNYGEKKSVGSIVILLRSFLVALLLFFYILTYYFYQILGNAPLIVKIHHKNILFLSNIKKQYFFFRNFYHYSITEFSISMKHIKKI